MTKAASTDEPNRFIFKSTMLFR